MAIWLKLSGDPLGVLNMDHVTDMSFAARADGEFEVSLTLVSPWGAGRASAAGADREGSDRARVLTLTAWDAQRVKEFIEREGWPRGEEVAVWADPSALSDQTNLTDVPF